MNYLYKVILIAVCSMSTTIHTMETQPQEIVSTKKNHAFAKNVVDGMFAGGLEILCNNPLVVVTNDLILRTQKNKVDKVPLNLRNKIKKYYKGCGTGVAAMAPIAALQNSMAFILAQPFGDNPTLTQKTMAACGAGYLSALLASPADLVVLQRQNPLYITESLGGTLNRIYRVNGLKTLYRGLNGTGIRDGIFTAAYKTGGNVVNSIAPTFTDNAQANKILCACIAGVIAAALSHPAHVITALMKNDLSASVYKTTPQTALTIVKEEGLAALFAGLTPRAFRVMLAIPLMSTVLHYEPSTKIINKIRD